MSLRDYKRNSPVSPTGLSREERTAEKRRARTAIIAATRVYVFARDKRCRSCGSEGRRTDHMHELKSRALLRGRPPEEIFTSANCVRLCAKCHRRVTAHELEPETTPAGADGFVRFIQRV